MALVAGHRLLEGKGDKTDHARILQAQLPGRLRADGFWLASRSIALVPEDGSRVLRRVWLSPQLDRSRRRGLVFLRRHLHGERRCRSSGGKDLRASSGTVELSLFSSLLATLPCWRSGPSSGSLASRRVVGA